MELEKAKRQLATSKKMNAPEFIIKKAEENIARLEAEQAKSQKPTVKTPAKRKTVKTRLRKGKANPVKKPAIKTSQKDKLLSDFNIDNLDNFERMQYDDMIKHQSKESVLQILINNVEGDYSQLSEELANIAEMQDKSSTKRRSKIQPSFKMKPYKLGDMYSKNFDAKGMLKMALKSNIDWGYEKLELLHNSFEDNNYHTASKNLWNTIQNLKKDNKDDAKATHQLFIKDVVSEYKEMFGENPPVIEQPKETPSEKTKDFSEHKYNLAKEGVKEQHIMGNLHLKMENTHSYILEHAGTPEFEFYKNDKGRWGVEAKRAIDTRKNFATLQGAVSYVAKTIYKEELKRFLDQKAHEQKVKKERLEKREQQGKPAELTPTEVAEKANEKVVEKIKDKLADGKAVIRDVNAQLHSMKKLLVDMKSIKEIDLSEIDKKAAKELAEYILKYFA